MPQYWVVGATVDGQDMVDAFVKHGFWFADAPGAQDKILQMQRGDRIAIKRMLGQGAKEVAIKAIGAIEEVGNYKALGFRMVYVKWIPVEKKAPFDGFSPAVNGPLIESDNRCL